MVSSYSDSYLLYTGFWTNWSRGPILGSTLTLTQDDANLFVAFVSFFVAVMGTRLWSICCLAMHFRCSSRAMAAPDALYHQRQAVLRNSPESLDAFVALTKMMLTWKATGTG
ncbi:hypothetical protein diail_3843 [Diaporthe ilicicola]|nr:hypothetical protein diail_3843 [Diaporthe ilicicola]